MRIAPFSRFRNLLERVGHVWRYPSHHHF